MSTLIGLIAVVLTGFIALPSQAVAWNIPGPCSAVRSLFKSCALKTHRPLSLYETPSKSNPGTIVDGKTSSTSSPGPERDEMLFMLTARWADDIRTRDKAQHRGPWHYIDWPFKPDGQPGSVQTKPPAAVNILTALAENERIAKTDNDPTRRAIALSWLFHLVGDWCHDWCQIFTFDIHSTSSYDSVKSKDATRSPDPVSLGEAC